MNRGIDAEPESDSKLRTREIRSRTSENFVPLLRSLKSSLLVSTYAAGKLVVVGVHDESLNLSFLNFEQCMGVAIGPKRLAVGTGQQIWFLENDRSLAPRVEPVGTHDGCYLARTSFLTGQIQGHEMGWVNDELWVVNTLFSCLCSLHTGYNFVPRWRPPFISELEANDRCHLNGMALEHGIPRYVTAMAETNTPGGWREHKSKTGCIIDVQSNEVISRGFAMPHSPRVYNDKLWVLNSGCGELATIDRKTGQSETVESVPGYTRGLAFCGPFAFVGMSQIRETSVFGGVPIAEKRDELRCGVAVIDLRSGKSVAYLEFETGVQEVFDVQVLPGMANPYLLGPHAVVDQAKTLWVVPPV
jgi:uncharacterized protein (TIGR03032 family)